jgi:hypothetical protein
MADVQLNADAANIPAVNFVDQGSDPSAPGSGHVLFYTKGGVPFVRASTGSLVLLALLLPLPTDVWRSETQEDSSLPSPWEPRGS